MRFELVAKAFDEIEKTSKRLDMTTQLAKLFNETPAEDMRNVVYFLQGRLAPAYKNIETGLGEKLVVQAIARSTGYTKEEVEKIQRPEIWERPRRNTWRKKHSSLLCVKLSR